MTNSDEYLTRRQARDLARRLARLERKQRSTAAAHADLRHSALDGGARIPVKDDQGNTTAYVGSGPTGIEHVGGPVPAQPAPVFVDAGQRVIKVQHSGLDVNDDPAPADFRRAEVHVSQDVTFEPSLSTFATNLDAANGSVTHSLSAGEWYVGVVWVTLSGQRSAMSEPVLAVIEPPVDVQDLQDTLDAAQEALDEYRDNVAAPRFQSLEEGLSENNDNLENARERLAEAEETLSPLPGRIESAEQDVAAAQVEATKAAAAAVEANNRAMTRLANGNFESGLDYWKPGLVLSDDSHSGSHSALVNVPVSTALEPSTSLPVVPGQIWELNFYYKSENEEATKSALRVEMVDGDSDDVLEIWTLRNPNHEWVDSGTFRHVVPENTSMLTFRVSRNPGGWSISRWLVDDITLRDVTDVVRLEEAANANRQKAEQAISELAVLQLAVDGDGGLRDRLASAESTLAEKADQSELPALETRLSDAFGAGISTALDTAAADATAKANAAQAAAETKAQELAEAEAAAAQSAAEATAAADAAQKAQKAHDDAVAAASSDATAKADAAKTAAEAAAAADAKAKADAAQAEAIRQAKADATAKANAAKAAAEQAAAADAKAKADAAQAEAIRQAKLDATEKADAAKTAAEQAAKEYADQQDVILKGEAAADAQTKADAVREVAQAARDRAEAILLRGDNLVVNGSAELGTTAGWDYLVDLAMEETPSGFAGAFTLSDTRTHASFWQTEKIAVDPTRTYRGTALIKGAPGMLHYLMLVQFDVDGLNINHQNAFRVKGSDTKLAEPVKNGDTHIVVEDSSGWDQNLSTGNQIGVWPYATQAGPVYQIEDGYTRHVQSIAGFTIEGNVIHLGRPWSLGSFPAGADVAQNRVGGGYLYLRNRRVDHDGWELFTGTTRAGMGSGFVESNANMLRPGVATVSIGFLMNYQNNVDAKPYFTGVRFVDATDEQGVTQALADAEAAQADADAAQARADEAHANAGTAWTHADAAMTRAGEAESNAKDHADALPKVLHGTSAPSGTAPNGSIWWQHQGSLSGAVVGQWNRANGSWQSTPIDSEAIANLDVGKLTAGSSEIAEAVINKLWAELGVFDRLQAREGWIGGTLLADGAVTAEKIHATRELITRIMGAEWAYISERLIVDGSILTRDLEALSAAIQSLTVTQRADIAELWAEELWTALAVIEELQAEEAWITSAMISELTAEKVTVTQDFVGRVAELLHLVVDRIDVNTLWADQTWQQAGHFGSSSADQSTLVDGTGLRITKHDHENGTSTDIARLGGEGIGLVFTDAETDEVTGSLSPEGDASLRDVSADTLSLYGTQLLPPDTPVEVHNNNLWDAQPRGLVCFHERDMSGVTMNHDQFGFIEVNHPVRADRVYRVSTNEFLMSTDGAYRGRFMYTLGDGSESPHTGSAQLGGTWVVSQSNTNTTSGSHVFTPATDGVMRILLVVERAGASTGITFNNAASYATVQLRLEDLGPARPYTGMDRNASHGGTGTFPDPQPIGGAIITEWHAQWYQNYSHNGTVQRTTHESNWKHNPGGEGGFGSGGPVQGQHSAAGSSTGRWAALFGFPSAGISSNDAELGKTLQQALSGKTIHSIILEYQLSGAQQSANWARINFGAHPHTTPPPQHPGFGVLIADDQRSRVGETMRMIIDPDQFGALLKSGDFQTISISTGSNLATYAGWLDWYSLRPKLIISYS